MKINELISQFEIYATNEEKELLEKIDKPSLFDSFNERERLIIDNLVKKSLLSRLSHKGITLVVRNGNSETY